MSKLLIVVDFQNDFVDGALGFEKAKELELIIYDKAKKALDNGDRVVFTMDTHYDNYLETQEGKRLPIPHCIVDTYGWNLYGRLFSLFNEYKNSNKVSMFRKDTFGCYLLGQLLTNEEDEFDEIEFCGVVTNMCVMANTIIAKTMLPEARIVVDASACSSFNLELHDKALDVMESMQMDIINR